MASAVLEVESCTLGRTLCLIFICKVLKIISVLQSNQTHSSIILFCGLHSCCQRYHSQVRQSKIPTRHWCILLAIFVALRASCKCWSKNLQLFAQGHEIQALVLSQAQTISNLWNVVVLSIGKV